MGIVWILLGLSLAGLIFGGLFDGDSSDSEDDPDMAPADEDIVRGTSGNDTADLGDGADRYDGEEGDDTIDGGSGYDDLWGEDGNDSILGNVGMDLILGGPGSDILAGQGGDDGVFGGTGDDKIFGGDGSDVLSGGDGDDVVVGGQGNDLVSGDGGSDIVRGGDGDDIVIGGGLYNRALAPEDFLAIRSLEPGETLAIDNFSLSGDSNDGPDQLYGGTGNDLLIMGRGDTATGGTGTDEFVTGPWMTPDETAEILDFDSGQDILVIAYQGVAPTVFIDSGRVIDSENGKVYADVGTNPIDLSDIYVTTFDSYNVEFTARAATGP